MKLNIREMSTNDAQAITTLSHQLGYTLSADDTALHIGLVRSQNDHCAFVAYNEDGIKGWIHAFIALRVETKPFGEIGGLVVDERSRNMGIGKQLVQRVLEWCGSRGVDSLRVRCNTKRTGAHEFYYRCSFKEMKEQKIFGIEVNPQKSS